MTDEKRWRELAVAMRREVVRRFPEWTGGAGHDPGVTLLELFGFVAESLLDRTSPRGDRERASAARALASIASVLATPGVDRGTRGGKELLRNHYFFGKLLDADDFTVEQDYVREKFRRHNRRFYGFGIVTGLEVSVVRRGAARVVIAPGFALDRRGEEIDVRRPTSLPLPVKGATLHVLLRYAERRRTPVARPGSIQKPYSRIEETFEAWLAPAADPGAIAIARLTRVTGKWTLDSRFEPPSRLRSIGAARAKP